MALSERPHHKLFPTVLDPVVVPLARVYAEALYSAAEKQGKADQILEQMSFLVDELFSQRPEIEQLLTSAAISPARKDEIIVKVFSDRFDPLVTNFLRVLNRRQRLVLLRAVVLEFRQVRDQRAGIRDVYVELAVEPDEELRKHIEEKLASVLKATPRVHFIVEPSILGGVVIRIDYRMYDGSLRTQLDRLKRRILERSRHEIQSRRDRLHS